MKWSMSVRKSSAQLNYRLLKSELRARKKVFSEKHYVLLDKDEIQSIKRPIKTQLVLDVFSIYAIYIF